MKAGALFTVRHGTIRNKQEILRWSKRHGWDTRSSDPLVGFELWRDARRRRFLGHVRNFDVRNNELICLIGT